MAYPWTNNFVTQPQARFNLMVPRRPKPTEEITVLVIVDRPQDSARNVITMVQVNTDIDYKGCII